MILANSLNTDLKPRCTCLIPSRTPTSTILSEYLGYRVTYVLLLVTYCQHETFPNHEDVGFETEMCSQGSILSNSRVAKFKTHRRSSMDAVSHLKRADSKLTLNHPYVLSWR
eukprot:6483481-Amphidinium_carterae.1